MIPSKKIPPGFTALLLSFCFADALVADDLYVAILTGVECAGCKKVIAKSLIKLEGVQTIRIEKNGDKHHKMTVATDGSVEITEAQVAEAIKHAEHYAIQSWKKSKNEVPGE
jgi:cation transport ATPase